MNEKKVQLKSWLHGPDWDAEDSAAQGARGCFSEKSSADIQAEERVKADYNLRKETIFKETSGRGHGAVTDQSNFTFCIDNLTRASTLLLCAPEYGSHLQQSLRRATAERGFHLPESLSAEAREIMTAQFSLYDRMQAAEIPGEDARFILPLFTKTTIQTSWDARELAHLHSMSQRQGVPEEVKDTVYQMMNLASEKAPRLMADRKVNYETLAWYPSSQLFAPTNQTIENIISNHNSPQKVLLLNHAEIPMSQEAIDKAVMQRDETELANLKHFHYTFLAPMSLATFHQATRQRTWNQSVQTIKDSAKAGNYITPPKIKPEFIEEYASLTQRAIDFARNNESPEALGILPHSLQVYDLIHVNGWNAVHSIGKRTCTEAQWEIRNIAKQMASYIKEICPELGKYAAPQGMIYGKCPERKPCGLCR